MKKVIVSILAILYIGTSAGANVRLHFCMDQLISWQLGKEAADKCERCGMKKAKSQKDGCCKDEQKFLKSSSDQKVNPLSPQIVPFSCTALPSAYIGWPAARYKAIPQNNTPQQTSPCPTGPALYLRNAVFRI